MCDSSYLARSLRQEDTPLNRLFFSDFNISILQRAIRQDFKNKTGISVDEQSQDDLVAIMRAVFVNSSGDHNTAVQEQVKIMNTQVLNTAVEQVGTGVKQFINFMRDTDTVKDPLDLPINTTTYGNKIEQQHFAI